MSKLTLKPLAPIPSDIAGIFVLKIIDGLKFDAG